MINAEVLKQVRGTSHFYASVDQALPQANDGGALELLYLVEYLNSINLGGFPPHTLELKVGTPVILLRKLIWLVAFAMAQE